VETYTNNQLKGAKLVVVRAAPVCSSNVSDSPPPKAGDSVELKCACEYADHLLFPIPIQIIIKHDGVERIISPPRIRTSTDTLSATASIVVNYSPTADDECIIRFAAPQSDNRYPYMALNAPNFSASCRY